MDLLRFSEVFSASLHVIEVIPLGAKSPRGRAKMPADGARSNLVIQGTIGGQFDGSLDCIDYFRALPGGDGRTHAHGMITTDDGRIIDVQIDGVSIAQPGTRTSLLRQTWHLAASDHSLAWVNREPLFVVGEIDGSTSEIELTAYSALEERVAYG